MYRGPNKPFQGFLILRKLKNESPRSQVRVDESQLKVS
jgi:hypothetical protein